MTDGLDRSSRTAPGSRLTDSGAPQPTLTIEAELRQRIPDLPAEKRERVVSVVREHIEHHSGPLPAPATLAEYDRIVPGFAERIMIMAESDLAHLQDMQRRVMDGEFSERKLGQIGAILTVISALGASGWMVTSGHPWPGGLLGAGTLLGVVFAFVGGKEYVMARAMKESAAKLPPPARKKAR